MVENLQKKNDKRMEASLFLKFSAYPAQVRRAIFRKKNEWIFKEKFRKSSKLREKKKRKHCENLPIRPIFDHFGLFVVFFERVASCIAAKSERIFEKNHAKIRIKLSNSNSYSF